MKALIQRVVRQFLAEGWSLLLIGIWTAIATGIVAYAKNHEPQSKLMTMLITEVRTPLVSLVVIALSFLTLVACLVYLHRVRFRTEYRELWDKPTHQDYLDELQRK